MKRKSEEQINMLCALGMRIKLLRAARGWSQEVLAEISDLHKNYIGHVERSEVNPSFTQISKLARAFDMNISQFVEGV